MIEALNSDCQKHLLKISQMAAEMNSSRAAAE